MNKKIIIGLIVALAVLAVALGYLLWYSNNPEIPLLNSTGVRQADIDSIVAGNNQFAADYYAKINNNDNNIFFSPYSITNAMAMAYEGASGTTAGEIKKVFYYPETESMRKAYAQLYNNINAPGKGYQLSVANALWAEKTYSFLPAYFNVVENFYGGKATNLDFVNNAEASRQTINSWVEDKTKDRIKELIPSGVLNPLTRLVITNAIYFKGKWKLAFEEDNTQKADFKLASGNNNQVDMMHASGEDANFRYAEEDNYQAIELPYKDSNLSMLIILPKNDNLRGIEESLSANKIKQIITGMSRENVDLFLPKFKFDTKYMLAEDLAAMGMPTAFSDNADFSGMDGTQNLFIAAVIHQAFVEVNEEGTEAAAATAIFMEFKSAKPRTPKTFRADHPFIFAIQDSSNGNILFMGRVSNPARA